MNENYEKLKKYADEIDCVYTENVPMSEHTSFKIGGPADLFITPSSKVSLALVYAECNRLGIPVLVLGNGSNMLVTDKGFRGAVISTMSCLDSISLNGACEIDCDAGVKMSRMCNFALENSLSGIECLWGIPGTVGGAAFMNAGAYDGEIGDVLIGCEHITPEGRVEFLSADNMNLSYRHSAYADNGCIITSVRVKLVPGLQSDIRGKMDDLMQRRKSKQPLEYPSAGSVFKRPEGNYAGTLIEKAGLKGYSIGGAMVSEKHAGFIVNTGNATCFDVLRLIEHIQKEVFLNFSIHLECEVRVIGER